VQQFASPPALVLPHKATATWQVARGGNSLSISSLTLGALTSGVRMSTGVVMPKNAPWHAGRIYSLSFQIAELTQHASNRVFILRKIAADHREIEARKNTGIAFLFQKKFE